MKVSIILYDDFETLDAFGPAEIFGKIPEDFYIEYVSLTGKIVNSAQGVKIWTELLVPEEIGTAVLIPGGPGARRLLEDFDSLEILKKAIDRSSYCLTISTGSALLAKTGRVFRRRMAQYEKNIFWALHTMNGVHWIEGAKWAADGKYYSSSGSITGMDMTLGFISDILDIDVALKIAEDIGYPWDPEDECVYI